MAIKWNENHDVFINREFSIALVKVSGGYMELDDYREGGRVESCLPIYSEYLGVFTNAQLSNMDYPYC